MSWPSSSCYSDSLESVLSTDKSSIYSFFEYELYVYYVCFNSLDGSILSSRYKSSMHVVYVHSIVLYGDYVISIMSLYLVMYSITTFAFTIKRFNGGYALYSMLLDSGNGR